MNLLVVDNSELLQNRLKKSLNDANHNIVVTQAGTYREAVDLFVPGAYDTIILDISLPDGSGLDLLGMFKRLDSKIKVIMFTDYTSPEFRKNCMRLGADHFFNKMEMTGLLKVI